MVDVKILEGEGKWDRRPPLWFGSPLTARDDLRAFCPWKRSKVRQPSQIEQQAGVSSEL